MEEEVKYTSKFDGPTTDEVLEHAKSVKDLTIPSLSNISGFVCIDNEGKAIGMMSKEQVASVLAELMPVASNNVKGLVAGSSSNFANPKRIYGSTDEVLIGTSLVKGGYCSLLIDIEFYNGSNNTLYHVDAGKSEGDLTANKICGFLSCTFRKDSAGKVYVNEVRDCMIAVVVLSDSDSFSF